MRVAAADIEAWDPTRYDIRWNADFTEAEVVPLPWWDDTSLCGLAR
jgi:hypothetical protein